MNGAEGRSFQKGNALTRIGLRLDRLPVQEYPELLGLQWNGLNQPPFHLFRFEAPSELAQDNGCSGGPIRIGRPNRQRQLPGGALPLPLLFIKGHRGGEISLLSLDGERPGRGQTGELSDSELADPVPAHFPGAGMEFLFRGPDVEVLPKAFEIHSGAIVGHLDPVLRQHDPHLGGIGIVGVVHELPDQLDALGIQLLADRDEMALVNRDRYGRRMGLHARISNGSNRFEIIPDQEKNQGWLQS